MIHQAEILTDIAFNANKPLISVLFETNFTKEIRIVLKKGTHMSKHKSQHPIVIEIVEGSIQFGVDDKMHTLDKGHLLALEGNVPHNLIATADSIVRLTLSNYDDSNRVRQN